MSIKSGTNAFHGEGYEYVRNTVLDAIHFSSNRNGTGRQAWHQNPCGANIGGPVKKEKFFFLAITRVSEAITVPRIWSTTTSS